MGLSGKSLGPQTKVSGVWIQWRLGFWISGSIYITLLSSASTNGYTALVGQSKSGWKNHVSWIARSELGTLLFIVNYNLASYIPRDKYN